MISPTLRMLVPSIDTPPVIAERLKFPKVLPSS